MVCQRVLQMFYITCRVKACKREEILDVVVSQFHHDQADQSPAT